jgi:hypothetical protein
MRSLLLLLATANATAQTPPLHATERARVSGADADITLTVMAAVTLGSGGRLTVFDRGNWRLATLDSNLKVVGAVGRRGQGPGELSMMASSPAGLRLGRLGDSIWVYDEGVRRFSLFGPDRRLVRTIPLPLPDGRAAASYTALGLRPSSQMLVAARSPTDARSFALRELGGDGTLVREIDPLRADSSVVLRKGGYVSVPFRSRFHRAVSPDASLIATVRFAPSAIGRGQLHVRVRTPDGGVRYDRAIPVTAPPITRRMVDSAVGVVPPPRGATDTDDATAREVRRHIPATADPFTEGVLGDDGTLWLRRSAIGWTPGASIAWAWISPDGALRGELALGPRETIVAAAGTQIWTITIDADGEALIRRLDVRVPEPRR